MLEAFVHKMNCWLNNGYERTWILYLTADIFKHLKELSRPAWPALFPIVFTHLDGQDVSARVNAAYAINTSAAITGTEEFAAPAFQGLGKILSQPLSKKKTKTS